MEIEKKELAVIKTQSAKAYSTAEGLTIKSQKDLEEAKPVLQKIGQVKKLVKEKKEAITKPLNEGLKQVRALFSPIEEQIEAAENLIKGKMLDYSRLLAKIEAEKKPEIEEKVQNGEMNIETAVKKLDKLAEKKDAIPTRKIKKLSITDREKIPDEYWIIDEVKLRADLLAGKEIPGAKMVEEEIIVNG